MYPNPGGSGVVRTICRINENRRVIISVYHINGDLVSTTERFLKKGINTIQFSTADLDNGVYFIAFHGLATSAFRKLLIQN